MDLGSNEFYLEKGFGLDGNHRAEQQWDDESKLQLLEILQSTTDIKIIAEKMKKPRFEVWFNLVTLPSEYPFVGQPTYKTSDEILRALLGNAVNPITKLIDLLAVSVHPGLAAEAARIAMETILPKEVEALTTQDYWDISKLVWDGVIKKCSSLIKNEEIYIDAKMKELLDLLVRRISIKSELLQAIVSPYRDEPNPDQNDSTTQTAE